MVKHLHQQQKQNNTNGPRDLISRCAWRLFHIKRAKKKNNSYYLSVKLKDIPHKLTSKTPPRLNENKDGLHMLGAGKKTTMAGHWRRWGTRRIFRPIIPGVQGAGKRQRKGGQWGRGFGAIAASIGLPLLLKVLTRCFLSTCFEWVVLYFFKTFLVTATLCQAHLGK